jgi:hypothetical protein
MAITISGIDVANSIINTEFRLLVLEKVIDKLLQVAPPNILSGQDMEKIREEALTAVQKKYPEAGITKL